MMLHLIVAILAGRISTSLNSPSLSSWYRYTLSPRTPVEERETDGRDADVESDGATVDPVSLLCHAGR